MNAISLTAPERVTVSHRLVGLEDDWTSGRGAVRYPALPPGDYTFEVVAANEDGVPSEPVSVKFTVTPAWWETRAAFVSELAAVGGLGFLLQWARSRRLKRRAESLERIVGERTREVAAEKEKSDKLLGDILPAAVIEELKANGEARSRRFDDVTVLFADLVGFTKMAAELPPERVVAELDEMFAAFDTICRAHHMEKLKTIGDAYMAAGGLPTTNATHPEDAVIAALSMQAWLDERARKRPHAVAIRLRVGLHTGPVVAGVIGTWKFAYDIWGDAVNTASRMESSGVAGEINLSRATWERVQARVPCTARGLVEAKGKGVMEMFLVDRERCDLPLTVPPVGSTTTLIG